MRVVIDTNILVSFAIRPSRDFERLFDHIAAQGVSLVSDDTIAELFDVLTRDKFRKYIPLDQSTEYIEWYAGISELVVVETHIVACQDPKDDKFLSLAVSGKAGCIIAGDRHLCDMVRFDGIPIYRPAEFLSLFAKGKQS
jgi:putative PIN family toxin of toxin-antitoxin system